MILDTIARYNHIYIQMHDNPDADAIASAYGLYCYFTDVYDRDVHIVYGGRNSISKSNLVYMLSTMHIPAEYVEGDTLLGADSDDYILVTVDCQYGANNVKKFAYKNVAIIDHHQIEIDDVKNSVIMPSYNACATLVWHLLTKEKYVVNDDKMLSTALYYGILTDTNQFTEMYNPTDFDAVEALTYDKKIIKLIKHANISLDDMEIAGNALRDYIYDSAHECAVIKTEKCDPNILGLISDFLLQVAMVNTCVVFCDMGDGIKYSVRSCINEVDASELAGFLANSLGSGGGHLEKAGGFISNSLLKRHYPGITSEKYFSKMLHKYFESYDIIYARDYKATLDTFKMFTKIPVPVGYVKMSEVVPVGTSVICRTLEGDVEIKIDDNVIIMIGSDGQVYPMSEEKFNRGYRKLDTEYTYIEGELELDNEPIVRNVATGKIYRLNRYAKSCINTGSVAVYAKPLVRPLKIFTEWSKDRYIRGKRGDYFAVRSDDLSDCYIISKSVFDKSYKEIGE